jgi:hypothetical protein
VFVLWNTAYNFCRVGLFSFLPPVTTAGQNEEKRVKREKQKKMKEIKT